MKKKKIIIFSEDSDTATDRVMEWIHHLKEDEFEIHRINTFPTLFNYDLSTEIVHAVWFRRFAPFNNVDRSIKNDFLTREINVAWASFSAKYESSIKLGHKDSYSLNKLEVLKIANECGLKVPRSLVSNSIDNVLEFAECHGQIIIKCLSDPFIVQNAGKRYTQYTHLLSAEELGKMKQSHLFTSFFQELILPKYELRAFYLDGCCYCMRINSGSRPNVDYRMYDHQNPTRMEPWELATDIKNKMKKLMSQLKLNCGSFDFIVDREDNIFFLEVNPMGQFMELSNICNYEIPKKIANFLIHGKSYINSQISTRNYFEIT